jgi:hypothetical protein
MKYESRKDAFIAVSESCCYLCKLYFKHANEKGYNVVTNGAHKKIYYRCMFPSTDDATFDNQSRQYIQEELEHIIKEEMQNHKVLPDSDSDGNSLISENGENGENNENHYEIDFDNSFLI